MSSSGKSRRVKGPSAMRCLDHSATVRCRIASLGLRREGRAPAACPNASGAREELRKQERRLGLSNGLGAKSRQGRKRWADASCNMRCSRRMSRWAQSANKAPPESRRPCRGGRQAWDAGNALAPRRPKRPPPAAMSPVKEQSERAWMPPTTAYGARIIGVKRAGGNTKTPYAPPTWRSDREGGSCRHSKGRRSLSYRSARRLTILSKVEKPASAVLPTISTHVDVVNPRRTNCKVEVWRKRNNYEY